MSQIGHIFVRLVLVVLGYGVAALAASAFLHLIAWPVFALPGEEPPWHLMGGLFISVPIVGLLVSYFGFVPAAIFVGISEIRGYRGWLYHALSGGAAGFVAVTIARRTQGPATYPPGASEFYGDAPLIWLPEVATAAVAAGIVGGTAYWLIAGRTAGQMRRSHEDRLSA